MIGNRRKRCRGRRIGRKPDAAAQGIARCDARVIRERRRRAARNSETAGIVVAPVRAERVVRPAAVGKEVSGFRTREESSWILIMYCVCRLQKAPDEA